MDEDDALAPPAMAEKPAPAEMGAPVTEATYWAAVVTIWSGVRPPAEASAAASTAVWAPEAGSTALAAQVEVPGLVENTWKGMTMEEAPRLARNVPFRANPVVERTTEIFPPA